MLAEYPRLDILLKYSSEAKRDEYRGILPVVAPMSAIHFDVAPIAAVGGRPTQARFAGRVQFSPGTAIKGNYRIKAVIDRMVVVVMITVPTSHLGIRKVINDELGVSVAVSDVGVKCHDHEWTKRIDLPFAMRHLGFNRIFAILVQDPTPELISGIVKAVDEKFRIQDEVLLTLLEVALDFYPRRKFDQVEQVKLREQMVGLLQRRHHTDEVLDLWESDARQVFEQPVLHGATLPRPVFLFSSPKSARRRFPDTKVTDAIVRKRLKHGTVGNQLWLDSTLYKGATSEGLLFRIQHKIADRRDRSKGTWLVLPDDERRARIEVEISDMKRLAKLGLSTLAGFQTFNFRRIHKTYLNFWQPTCGSDDVSIAKTRQQLTDRGIYGCEIAAMLEAHELKQEKANTMKTGVAPLRDRTGKGATTKRKSWSECNQAAADAMDVLTET